MAGGASAGGVLRSRRGRVSAAWPGAGDAGADAGPATAGVAAGVLVGRVGGAGGGGGARAGVAAGLLVDGFGAPGARDGAPPRPRPPPGSGGIWPIAVYISVVG